MKKVRVAVVLFWLLAAGTGLTAGGAAREGAQERPKIVTRVNPVYPKEALKRRIEGKVVIEASTDEKGDVVATRVLPAENRQPLLEEAALAAVRQWKYEPFFKGGKAVGVIFTVTLNFFMKKGNQAGAGSTAAQDRPKIIRKVNPVYPEQAVKKGIEGVVVIEASINEKGVVVAAKVLPGKEPQPLLEEAALAAVRQWKYEPFFKGGKAIGVVFTVTMNFKLDKDRKQSK